MTRYFIDTEFYENGSTIEPISIAIVCEDGRELYMISDKISNEARTEPWLAKNVFPQLGVGFLRTSDRVNLPPIGRADMQGLVSKFVESSEDGVDFWAYFADYDWIVICQLFGRMIDLPKHFPKFCLDVKQAFWHEFIEMPKLHVPQREGEHSAIHDARWVRRAYEHLVDREELNRSSQKVFRL